MQYITRSPRALVYWVMQVFYHQQHVRTLVWAVTSQRMSYGQYSWQAQRTGIPYKDCSWAHDVNPEYVPAIQRNRVAHRTPAPSSVICNQAPLELLPTLRAWQDWKSCPASKYGYSHRRLHGSGCYDSMNMSAEGQFCFVLA